MKNLLLFVFCILLGSTNNLLSQVSSEKTLFEELDETRANLDIKQKETILKFRENKTFSEVRLIKIENIETLESEGVLPIKIPGNPKLYLASRKKLETYTINKYQWSGDIQSGLGNVMINVTREGVFGRIEIEGNIYILEHIGNDKYILLKFDNFLQEDNGCETHNEKEGFTEPIDNIGNSRNTCNTTVRVMVMYSQNAFDSGLNMNNIAQMSIAQLNNTITNSAMNSNDLSFQLAGVQLYSGFVESNSPGNDLYGVFSIDSAIETIRTGQNVLADIVILLTDGPNYSESFKGIAHTIGATSSTAYALVEADAAITDLAFGHEVFHLFGAKHQLCTQWVNQDCANATGNNPNNYPSLCGCSDDSDFANAYHFQTGVWPFRKDNVTIMSQQRSGVTVKQEVSNPDQNGTTNFNDVARKLEETACSVASFVNEPLQASIVGPGVMIQSEYGTWCANISNCNGNPSLTWEISTNGWNYSFAGTGNCITEQLNSNELYIRLTISCDGQTITRFLTVYADDNPPQQKITPIINQLEPLTLQKELTVFPNPSSGEINITYKNESRGEVNIFLTDLLGKRIELFNLENVQVGVHTLSKSLKGKSGLYTLSIQMTDKIYSKQIMLHNGN